VALFIQRATYLVRDIRHVGCDVALPAMGNCVAAVDKDPFVLPDAGTLDLHGPVIAPPRLVNALGACLKMPAIRPLRSLPRDHARQMVTKALIPPQSASPTRPRRSGVRFFRHPLTDLCRRFRQGVGLCIVPWFNAVHLPSAEVTAAHRRS
jgi:hypothetical protein